ncbi:MAG: 3-oxoacid CoA-transferase subunit A [Comamonadaceae bacterium]|nr:MAG: 3-oxoacid CoA-transferase subunit A [Comamonadaceae bacterium]
MLLSGFGDAGMAHRLIEGLVIQGARDLVVVCNNAGSGETGLAALLKAKRVRRMICSFPRTATSHVFDGLFRRGEIELELVPQGTLAERIRAAGAGIAGFYTRTSYGTPLAEGKDTRIFDGKGYVLELPIQGELALIGAERGDRWGNLVYRKAARNFGPVMAAAARRTVASVREIVDLGALDPEHVVTPGIFVHKVVRVAKSVDIPGASA